MGNYKKKGYRQQKWCEDCGEKYLGGSNSSLCLDCKDYAKKYVS